jgi:hypothetical protein
MGSRNERALDERNASSIDPPAEGGSPFAKPIIAGDPRMPQFRLPRQLALLPMAFNCGRHNGGFLYSIKAMDAYAAGRHASAAWTFSRCTRSEPLTASSTRIALMTHWS